LQWIFVQNNGEFNGASMFLKRENPIWMIPNEVFARCDKIYPFTL